MKKIINIYTFIPIVLIGVIMCVIVFFEYKVSTATRIKNSYPFMKNRFNFYYDKVLKDEFIFPILAVTIGTYLYIFLFQLFFCK